MRYVCTGQVYPECRDAVPTRGVTEYWDGREWLSNNDPTAPFCPECVFPMKEEGNPSDSQEEDTDG